MTPEELAAAVTSALRAVAAQRRPGDSRLALPAVKVERPRNPEHGDWATSVALQAARPLGMTPRDLAAALAGRLAGADGIGRVDVAGPGFLNVTLAAGAAGALARTIVEAGEAYGRAPRTGERVNVELVPADPTGPLHLGHGRWAAVGDAMARVIDAGGADVVRQEAVRRLATQAGRCGPGPSAPGSAGPDAARVDRLGQMVHLKHAGRLSKRAGSMVLMEDLVAAVGVDAARYALTRSSIDSTLELDVDLLASARNENPVHYVRYAHARSAGTARRAAEDGVRREDGFAPELLTDPTEAALLATLGDYPRVVSQAAALREPHRVACYLEELAAACHRWYDTCRVRPMGEEAVTDLHRARLWLNDAAGQVLRNGLGLLGVDAPASM